MKGYGKRWILTGALVLVFGGVAWAQAEAEGEQEAPGEEEMAALGAPGEHHDHLAKMLGDWTYALKMWMPGAPEAIETSGTMKAEPVLGGRFVEARWSGEFMGQPFEGLAVEGYDNAKKHYTTTWRDNSGTYTLSYTGHCEDGGKVRVSKGVFTDPTTGQQVTDKGKTTFRDDGTVLMESWRVMPDGAEAKSMEIVLTKAN